MRLRVVLLVDPVLTVIFIEYCGVFYSHLTLLLHLLDLTQVPMNFHLSHNLST